MFCKCAARTPNCEGNAVTTAHKKCLRNLAPLFGLHSLNTHPVSMKNGQFAATFLVGESWLQMDTVVFRSLFPWDPYVETPKTPTNFFCPSLSPAVGKEVVPSSTPCCFSTARSISDKGRYGNSPHPDRYPPFGSYMGRYVRFEHFEVGDILI